MCLCVYVFVRARACVRVRVRTRVRARARARVCVECPAKLVEAEAPTFLLYTTFVRVPLRPSLSLHSLHLEAALGCGGGLPPRR